MCLCSLKVTNFEHIFPTSWAHSCKVPTTGISIFSLFDFNNLASRGIPPAFLMAILFLVLLLQLHKAKAPARATSIEKSDALVTSPQSSKRTYKSMIALIIK